MHFKITLDGLVNLIMSSAVGQRLQGLEYDYLDLVIGEILSRFDYDFSKRHHAI